MLGLRHNIGALEQRVGAHVSFDHRSGGKLLWNYRVLSGRLKAEVVPVKLDYLGRVRTGDALFARNQGLG